MPIRLTRNSASGDLTHLPDAARARIEALIAAQEDADASLSYGDTGANPLPPSQSATPAASAHAPQRDASPQPTQVASPPIAPIQTSAPPVDMAATTRPPRPQQGDPTPTARAAGDAPSRSDAEAAAAAPPSPQSNSAADNHDPGAQSFAARVARLRQSRDGELWSALMKSRAPLMATAAFSFAINLLMLTGPLFMLQVYDRVMTSGSVPTLVALSVLAAVLYLAIGTLELIRSRVVVRVGQEFDRRIADRVFTAALRRSLGGQKTSTRALRELDSIRQFVSGPGPIALFDAPWTPIYLAIIFMLHWVLGVAATAGAIVLLVLAWVSERASREPLMEGAKRGGEALDLADVGQRNAEAIAAMGMVPAYKRIWQTANREAQDWQGLAADRLGTVTATTKTLRLAFQSMMLAIGAALALSNEISAGTIVAATIIFGRALAPVEQALGQWRGMLRAIDSFAKLDDLLRKQPDARPRTRLPRPAGRLEVQSLRVAAPGTGKLIIANVTFRMEPGQVLGIVGPSGSGKSTLTRALVGLWPPAAGTIRLDGAALDQWSPDDLGAHLGYLPQSVELFSGSVRQNIARFRDDADDAAVIEAAKQAHAHAFILGLPDGYETQLGDYGAHLSAGQRQRIALARALFGRPVLTVLDEPNANLDRDGDNALTWAIDGMRERGQSVIIVSHRMQAIAKADLLLFLDRGLPRAFGPRDEVLAQIQSNGQSGGPPGSPAGGNRPQRPADPKAGRGRQPNPNPGAPTR